MSAAAKIINGSATPQQARTRALIVPREHGAWGLLAIPLFTGMIASLPSAQRFWPLLLFVATAFCLFWLRTPVESLLGSGPMVARNSEERRVALQASILLIVASAACLIALMWGGRNSKLLLIGGIAAASFVVQAFLRSLGREMRMPSQLVGAIGLAATAPAAYYLGAGRFDSRAIVLWAANWAFAGDQIHFVQLRIHAGRAAGFREKFARGKLFFLGQILLLLVLITASLRHMIPPLVVLAFVPALIRGTRWFVQRPEPLDVRKLGWSEMRQGIAFGILLALAFVLR